MNTEKVKHVSVLDTALQILLYVLLFVYVIALFVPFGWGAISSLKYKADFNENIFGFPQQWYFQNYWTVLMKFTIEYHTENALLEYNFLDMMCNSVLFSVIASLSTTTAIYLVAYATTMYRYRFSKIIDVFVIVTMALPVFGTLPASIQVAKAVHVFESFFGVTVVMRFSFLGLYYFITKAAIKSIPLTFKESAWIDGASHFAVFSRIYIPLTVNILATLFILHFVDNWNDYQTPFIYMPNHPTAAYGLWKFKNASTAGVAHITVKLAACFFVLVPILIVFILFHNRLMKGVSLSEGIKE